ncbi:MAG: type II toxin-antitoxin system prevent-host-death family antitoxin [Acidobacteriota bacterium]
MLNVSVAELRGHLSSYLKRVRRGEEIVIRQRNVAVARLAPLPESGQMDEELSGLAAQGLLRLPVEPPDWRAFFALPAPQVQPDQIRAALGAEREEG